MTDGSVPLVTAKRVHPPARNQRRRDLWAARADDRRVERRIVEERELLRRYEDLKSAMRRVGLRIGSIADIAQKLDDPEARFDVLKARVERWDALWSITLRKRMTRGKIIVGGAVLAEIAELVLSDQTDSAFITAMVALLDQRVLRVRDRLVVRELLGGEQAKVALPLRPGGPNHETLEDALAALGEGLSPYERTPVGGGLFTDDDGDEADFEELQRAAG